MSENESMHRGGFDQLPEDLVGGHLVVQCIVGEDDPELCPGWMESVEMEPSDVRIDGYGRLHFADHIPTECAECGDRLLKMNEVEVNFHA